MDTFITVAEDCQAEYGIPPQSTRLLPPAHVIQYELLSLQPYAFNHEELLFEVHVRHKQIPVEDRVQRRAEIWQELFSRKHPCLRASMLPKKYGWGVHYNHDGKIAIFGKESPEYDQFVSGRGEAVKLLPAMRSKRPQDKQA